MAQVENEGNLGYVREVCMMQFQGQMAKGRGALRAKL